jgi:transcriptional regulator with XRE-family HTH domain
MRSARTGQGPNAWCAITQGELGAAVGVSNRVIAYYEQDDAQPPGPLLAELARALKASTDELLGLEPVKDGTSPRTAHLLKRLIGAA